MSSQQDWINPELGRTLRNEGIRKSAAHSDQELEGWQDAAYALLKRYCALSFGNTFQGESVRHWAHNAQGLEEPPDPRAWGAVMRRGVTSGIIEKAGFAVRNDPKSHRCPSNLWRATRVR